MKTLNLLKINCKTPKNSQTMQNSLTSLALGASIPTLLPNHSLTITTTTISISNLNLNPSPVFHHPKLTIFPTTNFFDTRFHLTPPHPRPKPKPPTIWPQLAEIRDGTLVGTYEKGFALNVTMSKTHTLLLNGVEVVFPDMLRGDCLVVHGVPHVLSGHNGKRHHHAKHDMYRVTDLQDYDEDEVCFILPSLMMTTATANDFGLLRN
ncbi:hypothetical protein DEO72_LG4g579 [Vigna unguiculata]|uniref:Uncharacterized protein n=1 Tax=Vigna unguiculata TaxID=3917 RepID=A0A4D6LMA1_VIGUN|nr:hypothetical protein DEO72_LG4g579 [Vigna unguiculata]